MKQGDTVISPKDNRPEQLMLQAGELYGNRTNFNYGKMDEEIKKTTDEETSEEKTDEEESEDEDN